ncbi:citrate/2-methylcitrate synthase [Brucepastera parasyntrophica]|uniref:citrate/2-methylcitrate synthase n=1 Tax=Brucepastera parasyntrophica TaxID=2880008 RepID=UPI00210E49B6|nr:citrate/2-methylcitrate synthase [Brucepastera parasyntrophica]ULQ59428.1 citrate/2-methylcitrate synthase [Brucepastera parasyntrophica]
MDNDSMYPSLLEDLASIAEKNDMIDPELYVKYNVKRGLRDSDGKGVLVGLTQVGNVYGYEVVDDKLVAVPGKLIYRGYDVEDIIKDVETSDEYGFEQVVYLLLFGELPTASQLDEFSAILGEKRNLPPNFVEDMVLKAPSQDIMNKLARSVLVQYSYDPNPEDTSIINNLYQCIQLIASFPCMVAYGYQAKRRHYDGKSMYLHNPLPNLSTAENFLRLIRADKNYDRLEAEILDLALILHAEHGGGNNSTFTVHVVSSSDTDIYSAISAAVGSLKGRRHGGANIKVAEMMDDIKANVKDWSSEKEIGNYLRRILRKEAFDHTGLVYGQGHAVYTISDPRATLLREKARGLAKVKKFEEEFNLYCTIEKIFPDIFHDEKENEKRICTNVDFYSGFVYSMLGIPRELYTPIFAISRMSGWAAHRLEELKSGGRIYRPAFKQVGETREYVKIDDRD